MSEQTFIFADLSGFTALTEAHGDEEAAELAGEFCRAVRALLGPRGAEEVKTIGDAMMIRVPKPAEAVRLGVEIVHALGAKPRFPVVHVGMHTGPAVQRDSDWFGSSVNLAARVAGSAGGDEVLLTAATLEGAGEVEGVQVESRGRERFRNVTDPVQLYRAVRSGAQTGGLPIDPVCRMTVAPEHCAGHLTHRGEEFCFCSLECVSAFAANPDRYAART
jgi:adenylate cyclase